MTRGKNITQNASNCMDLKKFIFFTLATAFLARGAISVWKMTYYFVKITEKSNKLRYMRLNTSRNLLNNGRSM